MHEQFNVLVVEDHELVVRTWQRAAHRLGYTVDATGSLSGARSYLREAWRTGRPYRIVVLDLHLENGERGDELLPDLEALRPTTAVIVVSAYLDGDRCFRLWGMNIPYVAKDVALEIAEQLLRNLAASPETCDRLGAFAAYYGLSVNQTLALRLADAGRSYEQTAERLGCSVGTVRSYWKRIYQKTGLDSRLQVLAAARRFGCIDEKK